MREAQGQLDFESATDPLETRDAEARRLATDPRLNVALEASAGTGKTQVLVDRYIALLLAGVPPRSILAITFTRKAAAEMRQRILRELVRRARDGTIPLPVWRDLQPALSDVSISTIDAFCLALLHEFPLEADVDPGFELADETETPRLIDEALDRTLRISRGLAVDRAEVALLFTELGEFQLRRGLARLLDRRLVAVDALNRFLRGAEHVTVEGAVARLLDGVRVAVAGASGGLQGLLGSGPRHQDFTLFARDLQQLIAEPPPPIELVQALLSRVYDHFLTQAGEPRKRLLYKKDDFRSAQDYARHLAATQTIGPALTRLRQEYQHAINLVLGRAVRQLFTVAVQEYRRTLAKHGVLDFSDVLERTLLLLGQMEEFSRSRFKLEARYEHVLVDEFQDTSRAQWRLIELLVRAWSAGDGVTDRPPTIFIVGDRKQSIYGFRDAEMAVLDEAARHIQSLRRDGPVRTAITRSFRSVRELLHFVNDVFTAIDKSPGRADTFRYDDDDRFPLTSVTSREPEALGVIAANSEEGQAEAVAEEVASLLHSGATVRDRESGVRRAVRPGDIAILFRARDGHRLFEQALALRRVPYYVYKGLGFFDADEIKDVLALLTFLAQPQSNLAAAAFLRSRFVRLSDAALLRLAPKIANGLLGADAPDGVDELHPADRQRLELARATVPGWLLLADRVTPAKLLDRVLSESAYAAEIAGPTWRQARENLKKVRTLIRRIQNRGYATLSRIVDQFTHLVAGGDESNAIIDAADAVNLMTVHAAKGLEFPIVILVNLQRGSGGSPDPIRVWGAGESEASEPEVSVGAHVSARDRDADAREAEESKRLLYVALTRARDRLYLGATLAPDGRFIPGKGGLGRVFPTSLSALFTTAAGGSRETTWDGPSGVHRLRVVSSSESPSVVRAAATVAEDRVDDFEPMTDRAPAWTTVSAADGLSKVTGWTGGESSLELGRLVHQALEAPNEPLDRWLRPNDRTGLSDKEGVLARGRDILDRFIADEHVGRILADEDLVWRRHEVPFSLRTADGTFVRGSIDCLVERRDGRIEVLEFKTGGRHPDHQRQLDVYLDAARALYPGRHVDGFLIYGDEPPQLSSTAGV